MGQCLSNVITNILDNIHKAIRKDPVTFIFIVLNIIYRLIVWLSSPKDTRRRIDLQPRNCKTCINKEPSMHHSETLNFHHVQTRVALNSATMELSLKKGKSAPPANVSEGTTKKILTCKSNALDVKLEKMKSSIETMTLPSDDNGHLTLKETHQLSVLEEMKQLFAPPVATKSQEAKESGHIMNMPGLEDQGNPISSQQWASKLRIHCLRKILENLMMAFPEIVQRSMQMYNESTEIPPSQTDINDTRGSSRNSNKSQLTPRLKNSIPVLNVRPLYSFNDIRIARTPIGHKRFYKKKYLKKWKRPSKEETDLPIGSLLHLGMRRIRTLAPEVCLDRSPNRFLEPEIKTDAEVTISKLQTIKNTVEVTERHESNKGIKPKTMMSSHVTSKDYSIPRKEQKVESYSLKVYGKLPTTRVREVTHSCPDGRTPARLFHSADPSKTSTFRLPEVFTSFKNFLLKTMEPSPPPKRQRRGRTAR